MLTPAEERDALAQLAYESNEREKVKDAEIDRLRAEVERLTADAERLAGHLRALQLTRWHVPERCECEVCEALRQHEEQK